MSLLQYRQTLLYCTLGHVLCCWSTLCLRKHRRLRCQQLHPRMGTLQNWGQR